MAQVDTMADNKSILQIIDLPVNCTVCSVELNPKYRHKEYFQITGSFQQTTGNLIKVEKL